MTYSSEVLADSPLAYWKLDDARLTIVAATASSSYVANPPAFAYDRDMTNPWITNATASGWIRYELPAAVALTGYRIVGGAAPTRNPKDWTFEGSNDGSSWTTLDTRTAQSWASIGAVNSYTVTGSTAYLYYRLNVSANNGDTYLAVAEMILAAGVTDSSGTLADSSGNGRALTNAAGSAALTLGLGGQYGTAAYASGTTSNAKITGASWMDVVSWSVDGWVNRGTADSGRIITREAGPGQSVSTDYIWSVRVAGYGLQVVVFSGGSAYIASAGAFIPENTWVHLAATWDGTTLRLYVNGVADGTSTPGGALARSTATDIALLNARATSAASPPDLQYGATGLAADEWAFYGTALSAARILAHYNATSTSPAASGVGAFQWTGSGAGKRTTKGTGTGAFTWSGVGAGKRSNTGTGVGAFAWAGTGVGSTPAVGVASGVGVGAFGWVGTGVGSAPSKGAGSGAFSWAGSGVGTNSAIPGASGVGAYGWAGLAFGSNGVAPVTVSLTHTPVGILSVIPLVPSTELDHAVPVTRMSVLAPVLSAEYPAHPAQGEAGAPVTIDGVVGHVHLWIDGQDVTYWRGGMTVINRWESEAPFGDTVAAFSLPQKNPWDVDGEGDLSFLRPDAPVAIGIVSGGVTRRLWSGFLDAQGSGLGDGEFYDYEAKGTLWQAQSNNREPHAIIEPVDIGVWIARVLNAVDGRRWRAMPLTPIGITTTTRGARDDMAMEYVQALLTEAITDDLRQWTLLEVSPGILRLVLKPAPTTVHATVAYGTPGVDIRLRVDQSTRVDRVFMRGIGPKMGGWANVFYPGLEKLMAPAYPNGDLSNIVAGDTDADTGSGTGVTDWQRRVNEIRGFANPPVSGVMSSAWVAVIDDLQRRVGVTADGSLGPQTWNATFDRAIGGVDLTPRRLAMASKTEAEKYLYTATGVRLPGVNPAWDGRVPRDVGIDAGPGKSKAQGFKLARKILGLYGTAAASGTIDWITDPNETDRTQLSHLSNIKVLGFQGRDVVVQVSSKSVELDGDSDGKQYVVTTRVDERARDATAVEDLLEQRRNAQADPSRNPIARNRASRAVSDQRTPWDSESPCGVLRRTAVNGASGLWSVVTVPFAEVGQLASIRLTSTRPFAMVLFASLRITENKLAATIGNPFGGSDKWRDVKDLLDEYGVIEAWGEKDQACGYSPKTETASPPATAGPFTGKFEWDSPIDYWTETIPYVSVAIYMRGGSGWISGEFLPGFET